MILKLLNLHLELSIMLINFAMQHLNIAIANISFIVVQEFAQPHHLMVLGIMRRATLCTWVKHTQHESGLSLHKGSRHTRLRDCYSC